MQFGHRGRAGERVGGAEPVVRWGRCAGCGTLGCEVARTLVAWGVHKLTLVDNGRVAFSNPARQSLFQVRPLPRPRPRLPMS